MDKYRNTTRQQSQTIVSFSYYEQVLLCSATGLSISAWELRRLELCNRPSAGTISGQHRSTSLFELSDLNSLTGVHLFLVAYYRAIAAFVLERILQNHLDYLYVLEKLLRCTRYRACSYIVHRFAAFSVMSVLSTRSFVFAIFR